MTDEEKRERFKRLATIRTKAILDRLRVLGNCSQKHSYEYSAKDIEKIFSAIEKQLRTVRAKFDDSKNIDFKLE